MDQETFNSLQEAFLSSFNFDLLTAWQPDQKEYKKLKLKIEKILKETNGISVNTPYCTPFKRECIESQCAIFHKGPDCCAILSIAYALEKLPDLIGFLLNKEFCQKER